MTEDGSEPPRLTRVALTGGPGGGKTTAADLFRRELGPSVVVVPEAATLLFSGGFPRYRSIAARRAAQTAIFHVQRGLEDAQADVFRGRVLLCDRGTIDGAAYWPDGPQTFFAAHDTTLDEQLSRYDAVLFFQTAAAGGSSIEGGNRWRTESAEAALAIDRTLRDLYEPHPRFVAIPHATSFIQKVTDGVNALLRLTASRDGSTEPGG